IALPAEPSPPLRRLATRPEASTLDLNGPEDAAAGCPAPACTSAGEPTSPARWPGPAAPPNTVHNAPATSTLQREGRDSRAAAGSSDGRRAITSSTLRSLATDLHPRREGRDRSDAGCSGRACTSSDYAAST